jgi:hypothetical protein
MAQPEQLDDLLGSVDVALTDKILDMIDVIVPPGTNIGARESSVYLPRPSSPHRCAAA